LLRKGTKSEIYPLWTHSRYWTFIRSGLRMLWNKYPVKYQVLQEGRRPSKSKNKRLKWEFQCASCEDWFAQKNINVDHITPCGTLKSYDDLAVFTRRLFCKKEELQLLCDKCHHTKTATEIEHSLKKRRGKLQ